MTKLAIIRIRGPVKINKKIEETLKLLRLEKRNNCRVFEETPSMNGMIEKVKDYVTWGTIDTETEKVLEKKKNLKNNKEESNSSKKSLNTNKTENIQTSQKSKDTIRLNPPKGGFERKGIKLPFAKGGALGNRGEKIKELILKML